MGTQIRSSVASVATLALAASLLTSVGAANANDDLSDVVAVAADLVAETPGQPVTLDPVGDAAIAETDSAVVSIPTDPSDPISVELFDGDDQPVPAFTIGLPPTAIGSTEADLEESNSVAFEGDESHSVVQTFEDGLRIATVIDSAAAPHAYTYDLPAHISPVLNADGSLSLESVFASHDSESPDSVTIQYGTFAAPWAVDAVGNEVATRYEVGDGIVTQIVDHSADNVFPVTADPTYWWGWNAFISNSLHKKIANAYLSGVTFVGIGNLFVGYIPNAYAQLVVRLVSALFAAGYLAFKHCNANGRGVILGQVRVLNYLPPFGPFGYIRHGFFCMPQ